MYKYKWKTLNGIKIFKNEIVDILWSVFKNEKSPIIHGYTEEEYQQYFVLLKKKEN